MLYPIVLAGPNTADIHPIQFEEAIGVESRFAQVVAKLSGLAFQEPTVVLPERLGAMAAEQVASFSSAQILLEPREHNPIAALLAALNALDAPSEALLLIANTDVDMGDQRALNDVLRRAIPIARGGALVALSRRYDSASGALANLDLEAKPDESGAAVVCGVNEGAHKGFIQSLFQSNHQMYASGVYLCRADVLLTLIRESWGVAYAHVKAAWLNAVPDRSGARLAAEYYDLIPERTIEGSILPKVEDLVAIALSEASSEIESWEDDARADAGEATVDCDLADQQLDLLHVTECTQTAVPCTAKRCLQSVVPKETVEVICSERQTVIAPGSSVALEAAARGAEHWIVLRGTALVGAGSQMKLLFSGQSLTTPSGARRQIENPCREPLVMLQLCAGENGGARLSNGQNLPDPVGVA